MSGALLGLVGGLVMLGGVADTTATAFVDVHVVRPGHARGVERNRTVLVQGERIVRIGAAGEIDVPRGARRIEGHGERYLTPGLTDAHVHLERSSEGWLDLFLANGVTTVFSLRGDSDILELRRRVIEGDLAGPTILTAGPYLDEIEIRSAAGADSLIADLSRTGYDFSKIHGPMPVETFRWLSRASRAHELPVVGHIPRNIPLDTALAVGIDMISHAEELVYAGFDDLVPEELPTVAARVADQGVWLTPTLAGFEMLARQWGDPGEVADRLARSEARYLGPRIRAGWTDGNPYTHRRRTEEGVEQRAGQLRFQQRMIQVLRDAGVRLLAGTDAPFPTMFPGFSLHEELTALVKAGLDEEDAMAAATVNPGDFVRARSKADGRFGVVAAGYRADLVLVEADPRVDLSVLREPLGVMVRGRWLDRKELDRRLAAVAATASTIGSESGTIRADLEALTGRFVSNAPPFDVRVVTSEEGLIVEDAIAPEANPRFRLIPVGRSDSNSFEVLGGPFPLFAVFSDSGRVMTLRRGTRTGELFAELQRRDDGRAQTSGGGP